MRWRDAVTTGTLLAAGGAVVAAHRGLERLRVLAAQQEVLATRTHLELDALRRQLVEDHRELLSLTGPPRAPRPPATGADMTAGGIAAVDRMRHDGARPHVVLVLQSFGADAVFAGIRTTVLAAAGLATRLDLPLRVLVLDPVAEPEAARDALAAMVAGDAASPHLVDGLVLDTPDTPTPVGHHADDVWLVTFWTTAWAVGRLVDRALVRREQVVYLVQDHEPGFYPAGDLQAKAASTYRRGFHLLVNSTPLAGYLRERAGVHVDAAHVLAPQVDPVPLSRAAGLWTPDPAGRTRVLAYARPSKPRNMFALTLATLRTWADEHHTGHLEPLVLLAGEDHGPVDLGPHVRVERLGKTSYAGYYDLLARVDAGLALMASPHPGHLALELPMAGVPTVTNTFEDHRRSWVPGLRLADPDADLLAARLQEAVAAAGAVHTSTVPTEPLGRTLEEAVAAVAEVLRHTSPSR